MRKRVLSLLLCLLLCLGLFPLPSFATGDRYLEINETNFPDDVFRQYIIDAMDVSPECPVVELIKSIVKRS